MDINKFVSP